MSMSDAEILEVVKTQICEQLDNIDVTKIQPETHYIKDLKADSLDVVESLSSILPFFH